MTAYQIGISYILVQKTAISLISAAIVSVCALSHITTRATVLVKSIISNQSPAMTGLLEQVGMCRRAVNQGFTHILFTTNHALISRNFLVPFMHCVLYYVPIFCYFFNFLFITNIFLLSFIK
jgi:hypothetical protein